MVEGMEKRAEVVVGDQQRQHQKVETLCAQRIQLEEMYKNYKLVVFATACYLLGLGEFDCQTVFVLVKEVVVVP